MASLFNISTALQNIYDELEENGGELTPELEEALVINEQDFKSKIADYVNLIKSIEGDIEMCAAEAKRLAEFKKTKENLKNRLKQTVTDAVLQFGDISKSGTRFVDLGTCKVSTRKSSSCEINECCISAIDSVFNDFIKGLNNNHMFEYGDYNVDDFIDEYNNELQAEDKIDKTDLCNLKATITIVSSAYDLLTSDKAKLMKEVLNEQNGKIAISASKTECANAIKSGDVLSFAEMNEKQSLIIK